MIIKWFDALEAVRIGEVLAEIVVNGFVVDLERKDKVLKNKILVLEKLNSRIVEYKKNGNFNFYQKAKLGAAFKWKLIDAGYDVDTVGELTRVVLLGL